MITIVKPANLVNMFPAGFLKKPPIMSATPANTSEIATKLARAGDNSKYSIKASGGNGNLFRPCIINAIAIPNLNKCEANASKLSKYLFAPQHPAQTFLLLIEELAKKFAYCAH